MKAEVTVIIELDDDEVDNVQLAATEIRDDTVSFLGQYGEIPESRVRIIDGEAVAADTGAPVAEPIRKGKARKAVKVPKDAFNPDERFRVAVPTDLPDMDPEAVDFQEPPPEFMSRSAMIDDALAHAPVPAKAQRKRTRRRG